MSFFTKKLYYLIFTFTLIGFFCFLGGEAQAANKYWVGPLNGVNSTTTNWSLTSGGFGGATLPDIFDNMIFNGFGSSTSFNANMTAGDLFLDSTYSGIVTIENGVTLTLGVEIIPPPIVTVSKSGSQIVSTITPVTGLNLGGAFTMQSQGNATTTAFKIKQIGSLATSSITNLVVYYKAEGTCSATRPADATLFGTTTLPFNADNVATTNGTLVLSDGVQNCLYISYDLPGAFSTSTLGRTIDLEITNPSTDVTLALGSVETIEKVNVPGRTMIIDEYTTPPEPDPNPAPDVPVNSCVDAVSSLISLKMSDPAKDPTVFYLQNCAVWKMEGGGTPIRLTNPNLKVYSLTFTDLTAANSAGTVRMSLTMANVDEAASDSLLNVSRTFTTTATVKTWGGGE